LGRADVAGAQIPPRQTSGQGDGVGGGNAWYRCAYRKYLLHYVHKALDTFVDAKIRKDVVAGSGVGSGLAAQGSAFSAARVSVTISR
jgi:hypothetical protein